MPATLAPPVVLVVEDETLVRMYAVDVLEHAGYEVVEAANAQQALFRLDERPDVKLMFTDINMPGEMDGFALAHEVRRRYPNVYIVLTSGKMRPDANTTAQIRAFVPKPYTAERLTGLVSQVLS